MLRECVTEGWGVRGMSYSQPVSVVTVVLVEHSRQGWRREAEEQMMACHLYLEVPQWHLGTSQHLLQSK